MWNLTRNEARDVIIRRRLIISLLSRCIIFWLSAYETHWALDRFYYASGVMQLSSISPTPQWPDTRNYTRVNFLLFLLTKLSWKHTRVWWNSRTAQDVVLISFSLTRVTNVDRSCIIFSHLLWSRWKMTPLSLSRCSKYIGFIYHLLRQGRVNICIEISRFLFVDDFSQVSSTSSGIFIGEGHVSPL